MAAGYGFEVELAGLTVEGVVGGEGWKGIKDTPSFWPQQLGGRQGLH